MNLIKTSVIFLFGAAHACAWWAGFTVAHGQSFVPGVFMMAAIGAVATLGFIATHVQKYWDSGFVPVAPVVSYLYGAAVASAWWAIFTVNMPKPNIQDNPFPAILWVVALVGSVLALVVFAAKIGEK